VLQDKDKPISSPAHLQEWPRADGQAGLA